MRSRKYTQTHNTKITSRTIQQQQQQHYNDSRNTHSESALWCACHSHLHTLLQYIIIAAINHRWRWTPEYNILYYGEYAGHHNIAYIGRYRRCGPCTRAPYIGRGFTRAVYRTPALDGRLRSRVNTVSDGFNAPAAVLSSLTPPHAAVRQCHGGELDTRVARYTLKNLPYEIVYNIFGWL